MTPIHRASLVALFMLAASLLSSTAHSQTISNITPTNTDTIAGGVKNKVSAQFSGFTRNSTIAVSIYIKNVATGGGQSTTFRLSTDASGNAELKDGPCYTPTGSTGQQAEVTVQAIQGGLQATKSTGPKFQ